jgi:glyoxylase-like metal-dependent hydrolase (beta-lactamase superfamily II)
MSEPTTFADHVDTVVPGIVHWTVQDDRIDFRSDAYAVETPDGKVLIDPLPLSSEAAASLGKVVAICLTEGQHQRSTWRLRKRLGVPVYAPEGAHDLEETPDRWYADGEELPGGLRALDTPGFGTVHCALVLERETGGAVLFSGDLVVRGADGAFRLIPDKYVDDPPGIRASVAKLLDLAPSTLCPAHGAPTASGGGESLQEALQKDSP